MANGHTRRVGPRVQRQRERIHRNGIAEVDRQGQSEDALRRAWQPVGDGYVESLNGKLREELLKGEIFCTVAEARIPLERWREHDDRLCLHSALE